VFLPEDDKKKKKRKSRSNPIFFAEPMRASNSFVGTEEYIAPVCICICCYISVYLCDFFQDLYFLFLFDMCDGHHHLSHQSLYACCRRLLPEPAIQVL